MNNLIYTNNGNYSTWSAFTQGKTLEMEKKEQEEKVAAAVESPLPVPLPVQNILPQPLLLVANQPKKADEWDKLVKKYLCDVKTGVTNANPHHNITHLQKGEKAEMAQKEEINILFQNLKGKSIPMQLLNQKCVIVETPFNYAIDRKKAHILPVEEIFKNYEEIKFVKSKFDATGYRYLIPCIKVLEKEQLPGIIEVTLRWKHHGNTVQNCHTCFRKAWHRNKSEDDRVITTYGQIDGKKLNDLRKLLRNPNSQTVSIPSNEGFELRILKI